MEFSHKSVLLWECIDALNIRPNGIYLDGTLGGGGHSLEICRRLTNGRLIGVDRDEVALEAAKKRLSRHARKVTLVHDNFENIALILDALNLDKIDGMLFDLGVSSPQLDDGARGFSYMTDAPLDMRMDRGSSLTAYEIVNNYPKDELRRILYEYGEERYAPQIAAAIEHDEATTRKIIHRLQDKYEAEDRGLRIIELEDSFQLCTKREMYDYLIRIAKQPKKCVLTDVLLETLSIIAYRQPVTKLEIEKIRGVKSDHAVNKLVEYNLACEVGRLDAPGRPILFGTTEEFLRRFSIQSIEDLPSMQPEQVETFKEEAEEEVQLKLNV